MLRLACLLTLSFVLTSESAVAQDDKYQITAAERAACTPDAERLCSAAYPDEDKLIVCLQSNRTALSPSCATVFKAGLKRRNLR